MLTRRERYRVAALAVFALVGALAEALSIGAVFPFMALLSNPDMVIEHPAARIVLDHVGPMNVNHLVLLSASSLLALFLLKNLFLICLFSFQSRFVCAVESRLGIALFDAYLRAPFTDRLARNSADRIRIVTGEVGRVTIGVMTSLITLFSECLVIAAIAFLLLFAQPLVAAVVLTVVGIGALPMQTILRRKLDAYRESRVTTLSGMFRSVNEGLGALREIKVLGREEYVIGEFARNSRIYSHGTHVFTTLSLLPRIGFETAAVGALLLAVIATVLVGSSLHEIVPTLTIFGLGAVRLLPSFSKVVAGLNTLRFYSPAVETVATDLKLAAVTSSAGSMPPSELAEVERFSSLGLSSVSYRYPGSSGPSLKDIDLQIRQGDAIAVLGRSGSGKTTLTDLMLGLLEPDTGVIRINGRPTRSLRRDWRGAVGLVPQEIFLIDDTVRRNVGFGLPDSNIDEAQVWNALRMAQLEERVRALPQGIDTLIGERGATLSGGERQRLGIARALYHDPQVLFFDEAMSALDLQTERQVVETIRALIGIKTIVIVAHRLTAAGLCNRIVYLHAGRIEDAGTFDEVQGRNPSFRRMIEEA